MTPRWSTRRARAEALWGLGAGASHLVSGHMRAHEELEARTRGVRRAVRREKALLFSSGYAANLGILTALAGRGDTIFADKLNHACLNDGALLSRATSSAIRTSTWTSSNARLAAPSAARKLIVTDAVFSMDGDIAPLPELLALAETYDALLVLDDAHGFGVLGSRQGPLELSTFGARVRAHRLHGHAGQGRRRLGAFVAGHQDIIETILQSARSYIFTTATPPALAPRRAGAYDHCRTTRAPRAPAR